MSEADDGEQRWYRGGVDAPDPAASPAAYDPAPGKATLIQQLGPAGLVNVPRTPAPGKGTLTQLLADPAPHRPAAAASVLASAQRPATGHAPPPSAASAGAARPPPPAPRPSGGPRSAAEDVDRQSIGDAFAQALGDVALEELIAHLIHHRDRTDLTFEDREATLANLAVLSAESARRGRPSEALKRDAVRTQIRDAADGVRALAAILQGLAASRDGLRNHPATEAFLAEAVERLASIADAASAGARYLEVATSTGGQAGGALLAMAAVRAQAAHVGLGVLRPWCAFLQVHDRVAALPLLQLEHRVRALAREERGVTAALAPLASFDPDAVARATLAVPELVAALSRAFDEVISDVERAEALQRRVMQVQAVAELIAFALGLRAGLASPRPPASTALAVPAIAGTSGGAATLGQVVISAEWLAQLRHLVEVGAITAAGAAELLRGRGVTAAMAQATDLPQSVKDLLGEGPTTDAMKVTNATGAGAARPPRHHVLPQEHRAFFEERGFHGDLDIDNFTVEMGTGHHQAVHGGGNWVEGRRWPGEWNQLVMRELYSEETLRRRKLTATEVLKSVQALMQDRGIPMRFVPYRGP